MGHKSKKPFPWQCPKCEAVAIRESTIEYSVEGKHDNKPFAFTIASLHAPKCDVCGEVVFDDTSHSQISESIRSHLGLLSPEEIAAGIEKRGLTQRQVAQEIDVSGETVSRWISGAIIQSRNNDKRLRRFFDSQGMGSVAVIQNISSAVALSSDQLRMLWLENVQTTKPAQQIIIKHGTPWVFVAEEFVLEEVA